jgi:hypothetical protein
MSNTIYGLLRPLLAATFTYVFMQLGTAQAQQSFRFDGGSADNSRSIAGDSAGNVFVGGSSRSSRRIEFAVIKHNAQGTFQWLARPQASTSHFGGSALDVVTDSAGNVYAAGYLHREVNFLTANVDWVVASFDSKGVQRWAHVFNGPNGGFDQALKVLFDPRGAVYVTGNSSSAIAPQWLTIKYSLDGTIQWQRSEGGTAFDRAIGAELDSQGNVVVLGSASSLQAPDRDDAKVVKYDPSGNLLWRRTFTISEVSDDEASELAVDPFGGVYITGTSFTSGFPEGPTVAFLAKYDSDGSLAFTNTGLGAGGTSIAASSSGVVTSGSSTDENGGFGGTFLSKFTLSGAPVWSVPVAVPGKLAIGLDGSVFTGSSDAAPGTFVYHVTKFSSAGLKLSEFFEPGGQILTDVALASNGDFLVTGNTSAFMGDILSVRFSAGSETPALPAAPSGLGLTAGKGRLTLQWTDNAGNESGFRIERSVNGGAFVEIAQVGSNVTSFVNTGLKRSSSYSYRVRAFNATGASSYSNIATGRPN